MHKLLSVDVSLPVIGQTLQLLVPRNVVGMALLETVESMIAEKYHLKCGGNLYFAEYGTILDYHSSLENLPHRQGVKLILM